MQKKLLQSTPTPSKKKKPMQTAGSGYTESSASKAAIRNCKACGGKWVGGKCVGSMC